ncbi:MAG: hypothetical protein MEQ07_02470 [Aquimonas sp.]|nr:hypothetical protein [Aquimonas sp.]
MAGHGNSANTQHRTGKQDALRRRIFAKRVRAMSEGARPVGGDPSGNPPLHLTLEKAIIASMPVAAVDWCKHRGQKSAPRWGVQAKLMANPESPIPNPGQRQGRWR